ncbi:hypothetical protein FH609_011745 [Streptomyces sp. 3MP-14]|uniref:Uncharacterized protein n=1 Tax=Streptomyces mimosae TaxID=2586635 RepID=A0A5N6AE12_9ACTN|nr:MULTISPECIES: hypothetical protein [Streptomyces]KAB8167067.1 hypothetical protein FH607_009195 [Streptomyces mimosae]KAB8177008.1 hypothetical protein FH609_011745 [Streptomyces sp. 3MP-14]
MDEPTLGEIARRLADVHADLKEDVRDLAGRLDSRVSMERYQLEQQARDEALRLLVERVKGIEEARAEEHRQRDADQRAADQRRQADRRLVFTALIAPVALLLLQVWISARGAGAA